MSDTETIETVDVAEKIKNKVKKPTNFNVIFLDDDKTTMEFVILVLMQLYQHDYASAFEIMQTTHSTGRGLAGSYSFEVASQKRDETITIARAHGYPLGIELEPA